MRSWNDASSHESRACLVSCSSAYGYRTSLTKEMLEMVPSGKGGQLVLRNGATAHWSGGFEVWMAGALEWRGQNLG